VNTAHSKEPTCRPSRYEQVPDIIWAHCCWASIRPSADSLENILPMRCFASAEVDLLSARCSAERIFPRNSDLASCLFEGEAAGFTQGDSGGGSLPSGHSRTIGVIGRVFRNAHKCLQSTVQTSMSMPPAPSLRIGRARPSRRSCLWAFHFPETLVLTYVVIRHRDLSHPIGL